MINKIIAGIFSGVGGLLLISLGFTEAGTGIIMLLTGYFIGSEVEKKKMEAKK